MDEIKNKFPKRKHPRLKHYDYSQNGSYFITICTKANECILGSVKTSKDNSFAPHIVLSALGKIAEKYIRNINNVYEYISVDKYVIMPNHVHLLITIDRPYDSVVVKESKKYATVQTIVRSFKKMVTREISESIWQESFYETILMNEASYYDVYEYIDKNPINWIADKYYR